MLSNQVIKKLRNITCRVTFAKQKSHFLSIVLPFEMKKNSPSVEALTNMPGEISTLIPTTHITHSCEDQTVIFSREINKTFVCRATIDEDGKTTLDQTSGDLAELAPGNNHMLYFGKDTKSGLVTVKFHLTLSKDLFSKDRQILLEIHEVLTCTEFVVHQLSKNTVTRCVSHITGATHEEILLATIYVQSGQYLVFNTSDFLNGVSAWLTLTYV